VVAAIIAPGKLLEGQNRTPVTNLEVCGGNYIPEQYLDTDSISGYSNSNMTGSALSIDDFIILPPGSDEINDSIIYITHNELFSAIDKRSDIADMAKLDALASDLAKCISEYPSNPSDDKRLPWASPVSLTDYRNNLSYDDQVGLLYGRFSNNIGDSNDAIPGNTYSGILIENCFSSDSEKFYLWENWKDHLFYEVGSGFSPTATTPSPGCDSLTCIEVNGGLYIGVIIFSGPPLSSQLRLASSDKQVIENYIEIERNVDASGAVSYSPTGNDILYCIKDDLNFIRCD
jgi:hypothetical protein